MSWGSASRRRAASARPCSSTSAVAWCTALPPICSEREPAVPVPRATRPVSDWTSRTSSSATPSAPETSWAYAVSWPCPWADVPLSTVTTPSSPTSQAANSLPKPVHST